MNPIKSIKQELSNTVEHFNLFGKIADKYGVKEALYFDRLVTELRYSKRFGNYTLAKTEAAPLEEMLDVSESSWRDFVGALALSYHYKLVRA